MLSCDSFCYSLEKRCPYKIDVGAVFTHRANCFTSSKIKIFDEISRITLLISQKNPMLWVGLGSSSWYL